MAEKVTLIDGLTKLHTFDYFKLKYQDYINSFHNARLLFIDFKKLKYINDRYGHGAGDACLKHFGETLKLMFPENLTIRKSGDEFLVLTNRDDEEIMALIDHFFRIIDKAHSGGALPCPYRFNTGIASAEKDMPYSIDKADKMMYHAKQLSLGYFFFDEQIYDVYKKEELFISQVDEVVKSNSLQYRGRVLHDLGEKQANIVDVYLRDKDGVSLFADRKFGLLKKHYRLSIIDVAAIKNIILNKSAYFKDEKVMLNIDSQTVLDSDTNFLTIIDAITGSMNDDTYLSDFILCINIDSLAENADKLSEVIEPLTAKLKEISDFGFEIALNSYNNRYCGIIEDICAEIPIDYIKVADSYWQKAANNRWSEIMLQSKLLAIQATGTQAIFMRVEKDKDLEHLKNSRFTGLCIGDALSAEIDLQPAAKQEEKDSELRILSR